MLACCQPCTLMNSPVCQAGDGWSREQVKSSCRKVRCWMSIDLLDGGHGLESLHLYVIIQIITAMLLYAVFLLIDSRILKAGPDINQRFYFIYGPSRILTLSQMGWFAWWSEPKDFQCLLLSACTVALIGENEVEFDIQVFLNLSGVLYIKKVMELPDWQLGARHQRTSLDSVFSCVMGGPFCCHKR